MFEVTYQLETSKALQGVYLGSLLSLHPGMRQTCQLELQYTMAIATIYANACFTVLRSIRIALIDAIPKQHPARPAPHVK